MIIHVTIRAIHLYIACLPVQAETPIRARFWEPTRRSSIDLIVPNSYWARFSNSSQKHKCLNKDESENGKQIINPSMSRLFSSDRITKMENSRHVIHRHHWSINAITFLSLILLLALCCFCLFFVVVVLGFCVSVRSSVIRCLDTNSLKLNSTVNPSKH